ncbi:MAG: hypothetical protein V3R87_13055 [Dehalococcoidia bacterium]
MAYIVIGVLLIILVALPIAILLYKTRETPPAKAHPPARQPAVLEHETREVLPGPLPESDSEGKEETVQPEDDETAVLECPLCGQANRIPVSSTGPTAYRCAKCKEVLPSFGP